LKIVAGYGYRDMEIIDAGRVSVADGTLYVNRAIFALIEKELKNKPAKASRQLPACSQETGAGGRRGRQSWVRGNEARGVGGG
jgi:hypothetical protein